MANEELRSGTPPTAQRKSVLRAFLGHQRAAMKETCEAVASLLPPEFREHAEKARDENRASMEVLWDGVIDGVEYGLDKMRVKMKDVESAQSQGKVKVDVE